MPKLVFRKIYDDEGDEMREGDEVIVNSEHEGRIFSDPQFNGLCVSVKH